jgi:putative photosynthetic complex assembly protein 2
MSQAIQLGMILIFATIVWWGATGFLLMLTARHESTFGRSLTSATLVALGAVVVIASCRHLETPAGAIVAFLATIAVWAAIELAFLMGYVVGPNRAPCPAEATTRERFASACLALAYHELALLAGLAFVFLLVGNAPNRLAFDLFALLWIMRLSTKLNVFFGVANASAELLPRRVSYLKSYFGRSPINVFFPVSVTAASALTALLGWRALSSQDDFEAVSATLLFAFSALAVVEHWMLVLPLPAYVLWPWSPKNEPGLAGGVHELARSNPLAQTASPQVSASEFSSRAGSEA